MIRNLNKINSVKEFGFYDNNLCVLTSDNIKFKNIEISGNYRCFKFWNNFLIYQNLIGSNLIFYDLEKHLVVKEFTGATEYVLWYLNNNSQIPIDEKVFILTRNLELKETNLNEFPRCSNEKYAIDRFKNTVECTDVYEGNLIWKFELGDNIKVVGDFILLDNLVIVSTTNQDLIGIELESGKELWRLKNIKSNFFQIQPITNYLISLISNSVGDNWYYVINPLSGKLILEKKFKNFNHGAGGSKACIDETHYYFISNEFGYPSEMRTERVTHLGCINLQTHDIEWIEKVGTTTDRRSEYQKPEIKGNKIYLLDGEQRLHIYELEK